MLDGEEVEIKVVMRRWMWGVVLVSVVGRSVDDVLISVVGRYDMMISWSIESNCTVCMNVVSNECLVVHFVTYRSHYLKKCCH